DPVSAYGGIVVLSREVDAALGARIAQQFVEVLFAPGYDDAALAALQERQNVRILLDHERRHGTDARHYKRVLGGLLVQDPDGDVEDREHWQVACGTPDEKQWGDLGREGPRARSRSRRRGARLGRVLPVRRRAAARTRRRCDRDRAAGRVAP